VSVSAADGRATESSTSPSRRSPGSGRPPAAPPIRDRCELGPRCRSDDERLAQCSGGRLVIYPRWSRIGRRPAARGNNASFALGAFNLTLTKNLDVGTGAAFSGTDRSSLAGNRGDDGTNSVKVPRLRRHRYLLVGSNVHGLRGIQVDGRGQDHQQRVPGCKATATDHTHDTSSITVTSDNSCAHCREQ